MMNENEALTNEKIPLKNLSGKRCVPTEFVKQTMKIKRAVSQWLEKTEIFEIFSKEADLIKLTDDMSEEERETAFKKNKELSNKLVREKISDIFDALFEKDPSGTLEVLALSCFVNPEDVDTHTMDEYFTALTEMLNDDSVINFFISFIRLANRNI